MSQPVTGLLTLCAAARYCNVSRDTFRLWLDEGARRPWGVDRPAPWGKVGRYDRWAVSELDRFLDRVQVAA